LLSAHISTLPTVERAQLHRVARIAQVHEIDAFDGTPVFDVEAGMMRLASMEASVFEGAKVGNWATSLALDKVGSRQTPHEATSAERNRNGTGQSATF